MLFTFVALAITPQNAFALDIDQTQWGFDGQIVPHQFNLLCVLVNNTTAEPFDGEVRLKKKVGGTQVDAIISEPVFLAPFSSRWVQFYPYAKLDWEEWVVSWGPKSPGEMTLPKPRQGKAARVLLDEPGAFNPSGGAIKRLPDNLFPPLLTGTDSLRAVVLDHAPRWEEGRQRGFLDWIKRGGRVHILFSGRDKYPEFAGLLAVLNTPLEKQRIGSGYVLHHAINRKELTPSFVENVIVGERDPGATESIPDNKRAADSSNTERDQYLRYRWEGDDVFLSKLKELSKPEHSWLLIHVLSWVYLALVFPGCHRISRKRGGDYRYTFGLLAGIVAAFSLVFLLVGRRGYGETTAVHSIAIARQVEPGMLDVTQWSNAFATDGGDYTFTHVGNGRIYSSAQDEEAVRGEIRNGADGHFLADMPPFSSRAFASRMILKGNPIEITVKEWKSGISVQPELTTRDIQGIALQGPQRSLETLILTTNANFPKGVEEVWVLFERRFYKMKQAQDELRLDGTAQWAGNFIQMDRYNEFNLGFDPWEPNSPRNGIYPGTAPVKHDEEAKRRKNPFQKLLNPLIARSLQFQDQEEVVNFSLPTDRVRLFVFASLPVEFQITNDRFSTHRGQALYSIDVFEPEVKLNAE